MKKNMSKKDMVLMLTEQMNMSTVNLLGPSIHKQERGVYFYAFIISKYTTALIPVNYGTLTANQVSDIIQDKISGKFDVFLLGVKESINEIDDVFIASLLNNLMPSLQKEIRDYYKSMMG